MYIFSFILIDTIFCLALGGRNIYKCHLNKSNRNNKKKKLKKKKEKEVLSSCHVQCC